jgi:hypothetical protein
MYRGSIVCISERLGSNLAALVAIYAGSVHKEVARDVVFNAQSWIRHD